MEGWEWDFWICLWLLPALPLWDSLLVPKNELWFRTTRLLFGVTAGENRFWFNTCHAPGTHPSVDSVRSRILVTFKRWRCWVRFRDTWWPLQGHAILVLGLEGGLASAKLLPTALHSTMKPGFLHLLLYSAGRGMARRKGPGAEILPSEHRQWFAPWKKRHSSTELQVKWVSAEPEAVPEALCFTVSSRLYRRLVASIPESQSINHLINNQ